MRWKGLEENLLDFDLHFHHSTTTFSKIVRDQTFFVLGTMAVVGNRKQHTLYFFNDTIQICSLCYIVISYKSLRAPIFVSFSLSPMDSSILHSTLIMYSLFIGKCTISSLHSILGLPVAAFVVFIYLSVLYFVH